MRLKINKIDTGESFVKKLAVGTIGNIVAAGINALLVYLIYNKVGNEILRTIGVALFGIAGVESALASLIYGGSLAAYGVACAVDAIKTRKNRR